ncbi:MAG: hypothetical protein HY303_03180 [Candidatus Wallbacteria bacterium]|nr:hypothetical protein [Candidatus Wallbacteria bacterium]
MAIVKLTPARDLAVHGASPIACDPSGRTAYVVDRAGFRVLPVGVDGKAGSPLGYASRGPGGQANLVSSAAVAGGALYLAAPDTQLITRLSLSSGEPSWIGISPGGIPFLQMPSIVAVAEGGLAVWDPGLRMDVTVSLEGKILAAEKRVGLTPWPTPGGGHMLIADNPDGSWRLKGTRGSYDALVLAHAGGARAASCRLIGSAPGGGWVVHHYLGESGPPSGACLRWFDATGKVKAEAVFALEQAQDLPPPPGSATASDGRVWFLSSTGPDASVMVVGP